VVGWIALILGGLVWLYPRSGVSEPLSNWYAVWRNQGDSPVKPVGELSGTVIDVLNATSFTLRASDRHLYNIALLGATVPRSGSNVADGERAGDARRALSDLILSNEVEVTLTWVDPQRRGVGVVHLGRTNVNAAMVETGLVTLKRDTVSGLPLLDQYALMRADRRSRASVEVEAVK
jgi:endonuclease YncB( thermonuclease family)